MLAAFKSAIHDIAPWVKTLNEKEVWDVLQGITYKPHWKFELKGDHNVVGGYEHWFKVSAIFECPLTKKLTTVNLTRNTELVFFSEDEVLKVIRDLIISMEMHEVNERFIFKGEQFTDPHPELPLDGRHAVRNKST